jgi:predicted DNA helicase
MTPPVIIPKVVRDKELTLALRRLKLKPSDIKAIHYANNSTLIQLKKRVKNKPKKESIPSRKLETEIVQVSAFIKEYRYLIERERIAEIEAQIREIKSLSPSEREFFGRAILKLHGRYLEEKFHFHLVRFSRNKRIDTEISNGDVVLISFKDPLKSDLTGTVYEIKQHYITVAFENPPPKWALKEQVRIDLYINDITFKRMEENLLTLLHASGRERTLRNIILGIEPPQSPTKILFSQKDPKLNNTQQEAISKALGSKDLFLIHGPPGTGKTSTLVELIFQEVKRGKRVLASADSNTAVDNMLERVAKYNLNIVRIGHPVRIAEKLQKYSIHFLYERHNEALSLKEGWKEIQEMALQRDQYAKPTAARSRGMSKERILSLVHKGKTQRGISKETMHSMASWIKANEKIDRKVKLLQEKEEQIYREIIQQADVILATNSMVQSQILEGHRFDVAIIDEGSQQMIPSTLIPITKAERFIIAGDHKQLPPTVVSNEERLKKTLFENLISAYPALSHLLKIQYRMHEKIMAFSNKYFYDDQLIADSSVAKQTLADLKLKKSEHFPNILALHEPLVFIDTTNTSASEAKPERSTSFYNEKEAFLCIEYTRELLKMGLNPEDIGIITPYAAQIKTIKKGLETEKIAVETKTVDGFQGQEKEVIIISFVRTNKKGEIGFLKDGRRLNVSLTRAKRKLICIGNQKTLQYDNLFKAFFTFIKKQGQIITLHEE